MKLPNIRSNKMLYAGTFYLVLAITMKLTMFQPLPYGAVIIDYRYNPLIDFLIYPFAWFAGIIFSVVGLNSYWKSQRS